MPDGLIQPPARPHLGNGCRIPAECHGIGVDGIAGRAFQHEKAADNDNQQHDDAADQSLAEKGQNLFHNGRIQSIQVVRHCSSQVSAQLETAQRGLLETFFTRSLATVMKPHSATLMSGKSACTICWNWW